jgi:hypothetical protein
MNYTRPDDENHEDKPEDWLFSSLVFARALDTVLNKNHGILIDLVGDAVKLNPTSKRVIVFNNGDMISIVDATDRTDLKHGDRVLMISKDNIQN